MAQNQDLDQFCCDIFCKAIKVWLLFIIFPPLIERNRSAPSAWARALPPNAIAHILYHRRLLALTLNPQLLGQEHSAVVRVLGDD